MRGIIWYYTDREKGINKLEQLISNYKRLNIEPIRLINNYMEQEVIFSNKDFWKVCSSSK